MEDGRGHAHPRPGPHRGRIPLATLNAGLDVRARRVSHMAEAAVLAGLRQERAVEAGLGPPHRRQGKCASGLRLAPGGAVGGAVRRGEKPTRGGLARRVAMIVFVHNGPAPHAAPPARAARRAQELGPHGGRLQRRRVQHEHVQVDTAQVGAPVRAGQNTRAPRCARHPPGGPSR